MTLHTASWLIVLAKREFNQGCLAHWLRACCPEIDFTMAGELDETHPREPGSVPAAVVIYASCSDQTPTWVEQQIAAKENCYRSIPTVLISDGLAPDVIQDLLSRKLIDAVIPTSDTAEIAGAALRLILAGGSYIPQVGLSPAPSNWYSSGPSHQELPSSIGRDLTARELAVLDLLKTGKPNKIIAHRLGMSLSTAKVHVHNIIRKLKVRNRTEAVIAASKIESFRTQRVQASNDQNVELDLSKGNDNAEAMSNVAYRHAVPALRVTAKA